MIEKLIAFLNWIQSSDTLRKWVDRTFSFIFLLVSASVIWNVYTEVIADCYRYSYCDTLFPWDTFTGTILGGLLTLSIIISIIYAAWKKIRSIEYSTLRVIFNTTLPFLVGLILLKLYDDGGSSGPKWYIYLFGGLYAFSPIIHFLKENLTSKKFIQKIFDFYSRYIVAFLIGFVIFIVLYGLTNTVWGGMRYMDFSEIIVYIFMVFCGFGFGIWIILSYAWDEVKPIEEGSARNIRKGAIYLAALFVCIWLSPDWKSVIIDDRIDKAGTLLIEYGETQEGYKKAASVWGLKWAMKERYLENRLYQKALYAKIFDQSIESAIDEEIDVNTYRSRSSNATSMLARGENAKVELNFAKHESVILSDIGAIETTVTYEFQNTDTQNQEVIYSIELPNAESAMTELKLGLNLELIGVLAPRGAAEQVYIDSLRRNTDPALLEQTGPTTYRLRVFPVLSKNDATSQGRQRVQFKYVSPLSSGEAVTLMPKTDILNLKLTDKSEILTRVSEGTKVLIQDSEKTDDIETLNAGKVALLDTNIVKDVGSFCSANTYPNLDMSQFGNTEKKLTRNIVFLDISKSAGAEKGIKKRYQELIDTWKTNGIALDIYTFNTAVTSAGYDISDIDFWGTTDMARVITYITENNIEGANIVILTDDSSYELALAENKNIDYKKIKSNRISLIQVGEKIRTLKTEVTKSILASEGEVYRLSPDMNLSEALKSIFTPLKPEDSCEPYTGTASGVLSALQGTQDGKKVFGESNFGTGRVLINYINPAYLSIGYYKIYHNNENVYAYIPNLQGNVVSIYATDRSGYEAIFVSETGYYVLSGSSFQKVSKEAIAIYTEKYEENRDSDLLEKIGETAHIVNQSMSLIALENDRQRADLERYSNEDDKYDTAYQNFSTEGSSRVPSGGWMIDASMPSMPSRSRVPSEIMFGGNSMSDGISTNSFNSMKASSLSLGSSSDGLRMGSMSLGGGGSNGGILQYVIVIVLFPLVAWYILRHKPKSPVEMKMEEEKKSE